MAEKQEFYFDLVVLIDKTFKMYSQIDFIADFVNGFYDSAKSEIQNSLRKLEQLRIKVITFSDYNMQENAVFDYGFFKLPEQSAELFNVLEEISCDVQPKFSGCSSGLEALSYAIDSDFVDLKDKFGRHAVVLFTINKPLSIEDSVMLENYPQELPKSLQELKDKWEKSSKLTKGKKMLTLFCNFESGKNSYCPLERWDRTMIIDTEDINEYTSDFLLETILIDII